MAHLLLSGFGPFPGVPSNPTERLIERLTSGPAARGALAVPGLRVTARVLPTEFAGAAAGLAEAVAQVRPDAILMLGVAGPGPLRLERKARNASRAGRPDAAGRTQGPGPILAGAPDSYGSTLPLGALFRALEAAGLPVGWSDDAGGYVCNDLFFRTRHLVEQAGPALPCGFVHVPPESDADGEGRLSLATMERALALLLETLAGRLGDALAGGSGWTVEAGPPDFADWPGLLELIRRSFAGMAGRIDPPSSMAALTVESLAAKARTERLLLVREPAGRPLACAFLRLPEAGGEGAGGEAASGEGAAYLGKIAVEPGLQGRGLGRALVAEAERLARQAGQAALELQTRIELAENHRVFTALGFDRVAETAHPGYDRPTSVTFRKALAPSANKAAGRA